MTDKEPRLSDPIAQEVNQAIGDLERAMTHIEEEDPVKSAMEVGIAIGRLKSLVERKLGRV